MQYGYIYQDILSKTDYSDPIEFPIEPKGDIYPNFKKRVQEAWSLPSKDSNGNFTPSQRSTFTDGFNPNAGDWIFSWIAMDDTTFSALKAFYETNPPNNLFILYKARLTTYYLVEIADFDPVWNEDFCVWGLKIKLINRGVISNDQLCNIRQQ